MDFDFKKDFVLLDGAMGTQLQKKGLKPGGIGELLNLTDPELLRSVYRDYAAAGSQVVYANTFGANGRKLKGTGHSVQEVVSAAIRVAKEAVGDLGVKVALDVGPLGELLEPMGTLTFESAYDLFRKMMEAGREADLIVIETMTDLYEAKAALLAAKEATNLPTFVTMSFEERGRTFTGCTPAAMAHTLESLGADAIGVNCSLGPDKLLLILRELCANTTLPVIAKPNAGLPDPIDGHYDMTPAAFAAAMAPCLDAGVTLVGGCCGTAPEYIQALKELLQSRTPVRQAVTPRAFICSAVQDCPLEGVRVIGERINPTGKKRFQQALLEEDLDYILDVAVAQEDAGADILDVNVGHPGVNEVELLPKVVKKLQSAVSLPLQLDSTNPEALEAALRVYNGKAVVNSVNGEENSLRLILPIVKKYGAAVVGLTLDESGIPESAQGRIAIAQRILDAAMAYGIPKEDVWMDCLTLTVSAQQEQARETLEAVRFVRHEMGLQTVLGVSNISFGLPQRILVTQSFLTQAMAAGLTAPILNPNQKEMMDAVAAFRVLSGEDTACRAYIQRFAGQAAAPASAAPSALTLEDAILRGLRSDAARLAQAALTTQDELSIVEQILIPALDQVGAGYEEGTLFLPQLLSSAQAAQAVFEVIRCHIAASGGAPVIKGTLAIATVQGDVHDIGKNIVKTVLENYGYQVLDLGKDVPPAAVCQAVQENSLSLVGLSALMTTTLPAMAETVKALKALPQAPKVMVGGAVVTAEYAASIGADFYSRDAREAVAIAKQVFN